MVAGGAFFVVLEKDEKRDVACVQNANIIRYFVNLFG